nr:hypothetical protein BaRGS_025684 [Batillaria attramentaria]
MEGTAGGINTGTGTDVDSDGNVYVVGAGSYNFGLHPQGDASKSGYILKLAANNLHPSKIFRYGSKITAVRVREGGSGLRIMVLTDIGVAVLDGNFHQQYVVEKTCDPSDCFADLGRDGTLAVLRRHDHTLDLFSNGHKTASKSIGNKHFTEIAVDPVNKLVMYAYYFQSYPHSVPVQVPCVRALDYTLDDEVWHNYCVPAIEDYETQNMADSRPNHIYFSDIDNKLYLGGYTDGGNSVFRYDPQDISANHDSLHGLDLMGEDQKPGYDRYTQTWGFHGAHSISFLGRYNPRDGAIEKGQFLVTRLSSGNGNSVSTQAVTGGKDGMLVAAQSAVASLENRDAQTVNGQDTAGYGGSDATLFVSSPDFQKRLVWNQFQKTTGHSSGVAVGANVVNGKTRVSFLMRSKSVI